MKEEPVYSLNYINNIVSKHIGISQKEITRLNNVFKKENMVIKFEIFTMQRKYYHKYFQLTKDHALASLIAFYNALKLLDIELNGGNKKNRSLNLYKINSGIKVGRFEIPTKTPKKDFLLDHISEVFALKSENVSYHGISTFFRKKYRVSISSVTILKFYKMQKNTYEKV